MPTREMKEKWIHKAKLMPISSTCWKRYIEHTRKHFDAFQDHSPIYPLENPLPTHSSRIFLEIDTNGLKKPWFFSVSYELLKKLKVFLINLSGSKRLNFFKEWHPKRFYPNVTSMEEDSTILQISSRNYLFIKRALPTLLYVNIGLHRAWS